MKAEGNSYLRIFNVLLVVAAYGYLGYKLATFDDYATLADSFRIVERHKYACLMLTMVLMPLNLLCEAWKWRTLMRDIEPMTMAEAMRQVCYGCVGSFITPYRTGDYPTRVLLLHNHSAWASAVTLGLIGSLVMLLVELALGIPAIILFTQYKTIIPLQNILITTMIVMLLLLFLSTGIKLLARHHWSNRYLQQISNELQHITFRCFLEVVGISLLRYIVWGIQLALVLHFCNIDLSLVQLVIAIPTYYLLLSLLPSLPLADIAVRGSVSLLVFGVFSANLAGITMATIMVWVMNNMLPMMIGTFIQKQHKTSINQLNTNIS